MTLLCLYKGSCKYRNLVLRKILMLLCQNIEEKNLTAKQNCTQSKIRKYNINTGRNNIYHNIHVSHSCEQRAF